MQKTPKKQNKKTPQLLIAGHRENKHGPRAVGRGPWAG